MERDIIPSLPVYILSAVIAGAVATGSVVLTGPPDVMGGAGSSLPQFLLMSVLLGWLTPVGWIGGIVIGAFLEAPFKAAAKRNADLAKAVKDLEKASEELRKQRESKEE